MNQELLQKLSSLKSSSEKIVSDVDELIAFASSSEPEPIPEPEPQPEPDPPEQDQPRTLHWPSRYIPLTWGVNWANRPANLTPSQMVMEMRRVFGKIYVASDRKLGFRYVSFNPTLGIKFQKIDGPGGTLAFVYQPASGTNMSACGAQCGNYFFDNEDSFSVIDFHNVFLHETGHAIGIGHGPSSSIMAPTYRMGSTIRNELDSWTIQKIKEKYV